MEFNFRGLMAPVFTPFKDSFELDLEKISRYAEYLNKIGITGVLVNGTTGEGTSMTVQEREAAVEAWDTARRSTGQTLLVQVGGAPLPDVQRMARHAESLGVDGILCLPELFFRPSSASELVSYLVHVADAAPNTPLLYYHIPSFTGVNIDMEEFLKKGKEVIPTLAGLKFTHTDLELGARCLSVREPPFAVFLGADQILSGACALGFNSAIATTLNMFASHSQKIMQLMEDGNVREAREMQKSLSDNIANIVCHGSWVSSMKTAMKIITGMDMGPVRPPLTPLKNEQIRKMAINF